MAIKGVVDQMEGKEIRQSSDCVVDRCGTFGGVDVVSHYLGPQSVPAENPTTEVLKARN